MSKENKVFDKKLPTLVKLIANYFLAWACA